MRRCFSSILYRHQVATKYRCRGIHKVIINKLPPCHSSIGSKQDKLVVVSCRNRTNPLRRQTFYVIWVAEFTGNHGQWSIEIGSVSCTSQPSKVCTVLLTIVTVYHARACVRACVCPSKRTGTSWRFSWNLERTSCHWRLTHVRNSQYSTISNTNKATM
jgi:hypothetical protein